MMDNEVLLEQKLTLYFQALFASLHKQQDLIVMCFGEAQRNPAVRTRIEETIRENISLGSDLYSLQKRMIEE
ncbi:hypothetical protein [Paenibacillus sp. OSY-SE]|uniref:hypothetical protein n=1 Tax=Paenibacillus sp. OSY-SE TaxID=1196323 RepID=UPI0002E0A6F8|nr:hypothetical protein [Paenibacillus sp. OSY-SE]